MLKTILLRDTNTAWILLEKNANTSISEWCLLNFSSDKCEHKKQLLLLGEKNELNRTELNKARHVIFEDKRAADTKILTSKDKTFESGCVFLSINDDDFNTLLNSGWKFFVATRDPVDRFLSFLNDKQHRLRKLPGYQQHKGESIEKQLDHAIDALSITVSFQNMKHQDSEDKMQLVSDDILEYASILTDRHIINQRNLLRSITDKLYCPNYMPRLIENIIPIDVHSLNKAIEFYFKDLALTRMNSTNATRNKKFKRSALTKCQLKRLEHILMDDFIMFSYFARFKFGYFSTKAKNSVF